MYRSISCIMIIFQWLQFILKIRCNYHHLTTHLCFKGNQLRTQHWTVHSQKILMAAVASIVWLRERGIGVVNRIDSWSIWSWGIIFTFTLHWGKGELEQLGGVAQLGFELLSLIIDPHQQNICNTSFQLVSLKITYLV